LDIKSCKYEQLQDQVVGEAGTQASALAFGGDPGSPPFATAATEEWTGAGAALTKTITTS
jgi:hypothetical protein